MHARASAWFTAQGLVDEAVIHALKAGDPVGAAGLVEEQVHPALDRENWHQFEHWIRLLPPEVRKRPRLLTAQAWLHVLRYQFTCCRRAARRRGRRHRCRAGNRAGLGKHRPR